MDRRYKDYYIVTFKRHYDFYSWSSGFQTTSFCNFPRFIKVHWRSIDSIPYALVSVDKDKSKAAMYIIKNRFGVDKIIPYTEQKERDWAMWNKILRLPENDYWVKRKIAHCMQKDLFIDWSEIENE